MITGVDVTFKIHCDWCKKAFVYPRLPWSSMDTSQPRIPPYSHALHDALTQAGWSDTEGTQLCPRCSPTIPTLGAPCTEPSSFDATTVPPTPS